MPLVSGTIREMKNEEQLGNQVAAIGLMKRSGRPEDEAEVGLMQRSRGEAGRVGCDRWRSNPAAVTGLMQSCLVEKWDQFD